MESSGGVCPVLVIRNKIQLLFDKILEPGYVMNNYYADGLINKLYTTPTDPDVAILETNPLMSDLLIKALNSAENAHITVKVFLIRLLAIASRNEIHFSKIFAVVESGIASDFNEILSPDMNPSLRVAYLEVALALAGHDSGATWIMESGTWRQLLNLCSQKQTVFVVRQTYKFAAKFLWKLNDLENVANVKLVLTHIIKPIRDQDLLNVQTMDSEADEILARTLEPALQILLSIVKEEGRIGSPNMILPILLDDESIITHLYIIVDRTRHEQVCLLTSLLGFWLMITKVFMKKPLTPDVLYTLEDLIEIGVVYFNYVQMFASRRMATLLLDFCNSCNLIWAKIFNDTPVIRHGENVKLQNQLLIVCMVPCLSYVRYRQKKEVLSNDRIDEYIAKFVTQHCELAVKAGYAMRDLTLELDPLSVTLQSVKRLTCMRGHINNEQANLIFQALFYILQEYESVDENGEFVAEEDIDESQEKVLVMTYVLDIVLNLVKKYDINWQESLEVICLYTVVYNILKRPNLTCKFVVLALNMISVTINKFLPPNLSLLMETKPGSAMHYLGKLIYLKLHDMHWEVRDSALELLLECTEICYIKFPPLRKQLIENNLINVAAALALNDHEYYVRVSALRCLAAATQVGAIWDHLTAEYPDIQDRIVSILRNNQEGVVRSEACTVLCSIFRFVKVTPAFKTTLYEHLVSTTISDFHWEAQLAALKFWRRVICSFLTDQGMLDGTFPPVTFSRETRKIVNLTETEIQKRLLKVLGEISAIGCLTVLVKLLNDDSEVEVMEAALATCTHLLQFLDQYKVTQLLTPSADEPQCVKQFLCNVVEEVTEQENRGENSVSEPKSDNVIESIVNADDVNLLSGIYERYMNIEEAPEPAVPKLKLLKLASPYFFVNYLKSNDFNAVLEQKRKWKEGIRSLASLLDDILGIYEIGDENVNTLDCY